MGSFDLYSPRYTIYGSGTWTTWFNFDFDLSDLPSGHWYDIKYFYHISGGSDPNGNFAGMHATHGGSDSFSLQLYPREQYVFKFELWDRTDSYNTESYLSDYWITVPPPPILQWSWDNDYNSYNYKFGNASSSALSSSKQAANGSRQPTTDFKREVWNDLIDWLIYAYKIAANNQNVTDQSFYPYWITTDRAYLTSRNSHPDPIPFRASNWNLMSYIANSTSAALGGSSNLISQVSSGDTVEAAIFNRVINPINNLITNFNAH